MVPPLWQCAAALTGTGVVCAGYGYHKLYEAPRLRQPLELDLTADHLGAGLVSVIIPAYNEGAGIEQTLAALAAATSDSQRVEVVLVDAGCKDDTVARAQRTRLPLSRGLRTTTSHGGRGPALIAGAAAAQGDLLLFLHADTLLPAGYDALLRSAFADPAVLMTCFRFGVDRRPCSSAVPRGLGLLEWLVERRTRLRLFPYGDQALCLTAHHYAVLGGFAPVVMMEDFEFVRRVKSSVQAGNGKLVQLDAVALCSPRRWLQKGVLETSLLNMSYVFAYVALGWTPAEIYEHYYGSAAQQQRQQQKKKAV
jgi:glycosyltransferase involved in cell wall biosynthesis